MMSPSINDSSDSLAAERRWREIVFDASFSASDSALRNAAYSLKSPRWQVMAFL